MNGPKPLASRGRRVGWGVAAGILAAAVAGVAWLGSGGRSTLAEGGDDKPMAGWGQLADAKFKSTLEQWNAAAMKLATHAETMKAVQEIEKAAPNDRSARAKAFIDWVAKEETRAAAGIGKELQVTASITEEGKLKPLAETAAPSGRTAGGGGGTANRWKVHITIGGHRWSVMICIEGGVA